MRTLLVTNDFPPKVGGIQSYLFELVSSLDPSEVTVLAPDYPGAARFDANQPFKVFREPGSRLYPSPRLFRRICSLAADADVVQFGFALQSWVLAPAMRWWTKRPYVVFVHGAEVLLPLRIPFAARLLRWGSLQQASRILAVSNYTATGIERHMKDGIDCTVLHPPVNLQRFRASAQAGSKVRELHGLGERPVILCVSRLTARKGQDRLVDVMPELSRRFGAKLLLVGEGPLENRLPIRARRRGVARDVIFAGRVTQEMLPSYYAAADVFAMPVRSRWFGMEEEGFGVVFVEAAAAGLPMVVGDSGGAPESVVNGETGYLVDGGSVPDLGKALVRLLSDSELRAKMGSAARERAASLYSIPVTGNSYRRALESVAGQGKVR